MKIEGKMINIKKLNKMAKNFDTSKDFDAVMAYFDVLEIKDKLVGRNLLEMGSNAGTVTKHLLPLADSLDIVEGSKIGINRTKKIVKDVDGKISYFHELWGKFNPKNKYTDIIFVRGLEHVEDPVNLLNKMKEWLTENGKIHLIVPNANSLHRMIMVEKRIISNKYSLGKRDHQVGHMRVYDAEHLKRDVLNSGLKVSYLSGFFVKQISTKEIGNITMNPNHPLVKVCYAAGKIFPELGTQLYVVGKRK